MIKKCIVLSSVLILFGLSANAQYLISAESLGIVLKPQIEALLGIEMRSSVEKYRVTYMTTGIHGEVDTASGLIVIPTTRFDDQLLVVAYQHGTTDGPDDVPSEERSGYFEALAYGGMGYHVCAADYLGLGINEGFHPYIHAETEASAGLDLIFAMSEFMEQQTGEPSFDHLFVSGYSQGGHAAMALMQNLEEDWSFVYPMTAATPMSGPYSISDVMFQHIIGDVAYDFVSYPVYAILGLQEVYGNLYESIDEVFQEPYITAIQAFYDHEVSLLELTTFLYAQLTFENDEPLTRYLFIDSTLQEIIDNESHPIRVAMRENDTYEWAAQTPTRLLYCTADDQVPFRNSILADSVMRANGSADLKKMDMDPDADHGQCAPPAIEESIHFFDSFVLGTATDDVQTSEVQFAFPNPASTQINVQLPESNSAYQFTMISISGQVINGWTGSAKAELDISQIPSGMYLLKAQSSNYSVSQKIIID